MVAAYDGVYEMKLEGHVRLTTSAAVHGWLQEMLADSAFKSVLIDLGATESIESTTLGLLAKLSIEVGRRFGYVPTLVSTRADITRILVTMGFEDIFHIIERPLQERGQLIELPSRANTGEEELRTQVIDAHRTLMSMNRRNEETFRDLVISLEREEAESVRPELTVVKAASL